MFKKHAKLFALMMAMAMMLAVFAGCAPASTDEEPPADEGGEVVEAMLTDGTYSATSMGQHEMTVSVTITEGKIADITLDHSETDGIGTPAIELVPADIIEVQGLGVDIIGGATLTSNAIIEGVTDCLKQAGATDEYITELKAIKSLEEEQAADEAHTADVVVIGAGGAGMAAAVTANQAGKTVIVLEKLIKMGGNTALAGGAFNAVDDGSETALKNEDSVALHYQQTFEGGDEMGNPELVQKLVGEAWDAVEWVQSLGMQFEEGTFTVLGGLWQRAHKPVEPEGTGFFKTYQSYMDENDGITMMYETTADSFIVEDGVVVGVNATGKTGNAVTVTATNGVVLATGGFGQNIEMREEANDITNLWPTLDANVKSTNTSGITGDGIIMAEEIGANLVGMGYIQLLPLGDPNTGSLSGNIEHGVESRIFINLNGERFTDEGGRRDEMTKALLSQPESTMYVVMDSDEYPTGDEKNNFNETANDLVAAGRAYKADTLEELAEMMGVPAENLVAAVEDYNKYCLGGELFGESDSFGRTLFVDSDEVNNGINNGPYYAAARVPTVHHTMGGVEININTEVLNTEGEVIPGLFAAGEVTGGIHGANRLGGNALTDTLVFGRTAGTNASAFTK